MYEAFYGLRERPFNLTPDPKFLYLSDKHKEAFAHLLYGIKNRSGFVMLSGEIGTGKTTICRNLLKQLDSDTKVAFIFNPALNPIELMKKITQEFGVDASANTLLELVDALNHYLLESAARGVNNVLVIDESQNLEPEVLEQIRLLSNLETETDKLLQIILIGQPELAEKLSLHRLRQLNQRITARYHLHELDETETMQYIAYRLHVAGGRRKVRFAKGAVGRIHKISGGTPRVINALCDRCLLIGYTRETHTITPAIVKEAAKEIKGEKIEMMGERKGRFERLRPWVPSPGLALTAILIVLVIQLFVRPLNELNFQLSSLNANIPVTNPPESPLPVEGALPGSIEPVESSAPGTPQTAPPAPPLNAHTVERYKHTLLSVDAARRPNILPPASALATLSTLETESAYKSAGAALLRAWNLAPVKGLPGGDTEEALVEFAKRNGLDAEPLTPTLQQLRNINLPAFVQLEVEGKLVWSALISASEEEVQLSGAMSELLKLDADDFEKVYTKQAILLWQNPNPGNRVMLLGQNTPDIAEFKKQLRTLGRISAGNTDSRYDEETATAVSQIQSETGLWLDGKAGKQVRMVLMSWLSEVNTPTLGKREDTTPPVRHVSVRRPDASTAYTSSPVKTVPVAAPITAPVVAPALAVAPPNPAPFRNTEPIRIPAPSPYAPRVETPDASVNMLQPSGELTLNPLESLTISTPLDATLPDAAQGKEVLESNE